MPERLLGNVYIKHKDVSEEEKEEEYQCQAVMRSRAGLQNSISHTLYFEPFLKVAE